MRYTYQKDKTKFYDIIIKALLFLIMVYFASLSWHYGEYTLARTLGY